MSFKLINPRTGDECETPSEDRRDFLVSRGWVQVSPAVIETIELPPVNVLDEIERMEAEMDEEEARRKGYLR